MYDSTCVYCVKHYGHGTWSGIMSCLVELVETSVRTIARLLPVGPLSPCTSQEISQYTAKQLNIPWGTLYM